ncbi:hypothetical protein BU17DRAFT_63107 [Hysterangium stoloniferum]|nr:hypothetical protein BU17DRAFT_63107 [Hysterangium stoloniferum]
MSLRVSITNFYDMSRVLDGMVHQLTPGSASGQSSLRHCKHRLSTTHLHLCTCTHAPMHPVPASNPRYPCQTDLRIVGYAPVAPVSYMDRRFSAPFISPPPNCFISSTAFCCYEKEARLVILESSGQTPTNCSIISRATERENILDVIGAGTTARSVAEMRQQLDDIIKRSEGSAPAAKTQKKPPVFPAPVGFQLTELLRRAYQNYFRDAMYLASKLAVNIFAGEYRLFIGFTFFNTKHNYQGVQNSIFACRHSLSEKGLSIAVVIVIEQADPNSYLCTCTSAPAPTPTHLCIPYLRLTRGYAPVAPVSYGHSLSEKGLSIAVIIVIEQIPTVTYAHGLLPTDCARLLDVTPHLQLTSRRR